MTDRKISELVAVTSVDDADEFVLARSGSSNKITGANMGASFAGGGSQPDGVLSSAEFTFTEVGENGATLPITVADSGTGTLTVAGDHVAAFPFDPDGNYDFSFLVAGSTGNDGTYTTNSVSLVGGNTEIVLNEGVADSTADGDVIAPKLYQASLAMPEGTVLDDVRIYNYSAPAIFGNAWSADIARLAYVGDSGGGYYANVPLDSNPSDALINLAPSLSSDTVDDTAQRSIAGGTRSFASGGAKPWEGSWGQADILGSFVPGAGSVANWAKGGGGRRYATDDTLTLLALAASVTPPVPTGLLVVKVIYWTPVAAVAAA